jgi:hypothetical protein
MHHDRRAASATSARIDSGLPQAQRRAEVARAFAAIVPGSELTSFDTPGLDGDAPLALEAKGRARKFLDETGDGWTLKLPLPASSMTPRFAGGEERAVPVLPQQRGGDRVRSRDHDAAGHAPHRRAAAQEKWGDGGYELSIEQRASSISC